MTRTRVERTDALSVARRLERPVVLVFASATVPGGGWRQDGISGQEEQLCRASDLGLRLESEALAWFYEAHAHAGPLASDRCAYVPGVLVRGPPPWTCDFLGCAAPQAHRFVAPRDREAILNRVIAQRTRAIVDAACQHGHTSLVLGAWGCGFFANDPHVVARSFMQAVAARPKLDEVVFAVPDGDRARVFEGAVEARALCSPG